MRHFDGFAGSSGDDLADERTHSLSTIRLRKRCMARCPESGPTTPKNSTGRGLTRLE